MVNEIHAICQECGAEFDYILKPGFPRKYCQTCREIKKQEFEARQPKVDKDSGQGIRDFGDTPIPVVKPGVQVTPKGVPVDLRETPIIPNGQLSMYVSYAKDIFCAIYKEENGSYEEHMKVCTDLVKQAMKELS